MLQIKNYARVADSIVGWGSKLGTWSRLENHSVIGEDVFVRDEVLLNGAIVLPHKVRSAASQIRAVIGTLAQLSAGVLMIHARTWSTIHCLCCTQELKETTYDAGRIIM